jgi:hypothetical protein
MLIIIAQLTKTTVRGKIEGWVVYVNYGHTNNPTFYLIESIWIRSARR